jgi:sirohydrochlorin cobaltochelatase
MRQGLVLFGHGARDARWAEPLERVLALLGQRAPAIPVVLGFLEIMTPDLEGAVRQLVNEGCDDIRIVPMFLGQGGHVRRDLPSLVAALHQAFPGKHLHISAPVGDDPAVLDALCQFCLLQLAGVPNMVRE